MMCDCQSEVQQSLVDSFSKQRPDASNLKVKLLGYGIIFDSDEIRSRGFMEIEIKADMPLKKGGTKLKKEKQNLFFSYCPFCGKKATEDMESEGGAS